MVLFSWYVWSQEVIYINCNLIAHENYIGDMNQTECLWIGYDKYGATNCNYFIKRVIDDLIIYNCTLTDSKIQDYHEGRW